MAKEDRNEAVGFYLHQEKGEDRITAGDINGRYQYLIIADGATALMDERTRTLQYGLGGFAADVACFGAERLLKKELPGLTGLEEIIEFLSTLPDTLSHQVDRGATTLQIALLTRLKKSLFWVYCIQGDGHLWLNNPTSLKFMKGELEVLSSYSKSSNAPAILKDRLNFGPNVSARLYSPGDVLFMSSDGVELPKFEEWARTEQGNAFAYILTNLRSDPNAMSEKLKSFPYYRDDAVLGFIR